MPIIISELILPNNVLLVQFSNFDCAFLCFRHGDFSLKRRSENRLIKSARYATMNTREGVGVAVSGANFGARNRLNVAIQSRKTR